MHRIMSFFYAYIHSQDYYKPKIIQLFIYQIITFRLCFHLYVLFIRLTLSVRFLVVRTYNAAQKICFHDTDNVDGFCADSRTFKSKVTTFVHVVCDLPNMNVKCN